MNKFEQFAVDFYLSHYPDNVDYETILQLISDNDKDIIPFYIVQYQTPDNLIEEIDNLKSLAENTFN